MFPFELVATATASPKYTPAGSLRKFGTEVKGISGTPVIVAFCWADAEPARSRTAAYVEKRCRVMDAAYTRVPVRSITIRRVLECAPSVSGCAFARSADSRGGHTHP